VVEDDYALQQLYNIEFNEAGLGIVLASNGLEASKILMGEKPDLVITDIRMPQAGGESVMDCIEWNHLQIPVIVVSAYQHYQDRFEDDHRALAAYFMKPVDFKDLIKFIYAYLEAKPRI